MILVKRKSTKVVRSSTCTVPVHCTVVLIKGIFFLRTYRYVPYRYRTTVHHWSKFSWNLLPVLCIIEASMLTVLLSIPAFQVVVSPRGVLRAASPQLMASEESPADKLQKAFKLFQEGNSAGGFKQGVADALAGEYDRDSVTAQVKEIVASAPLVIFTWQASPACKKALKYLDMAGVAPKIVRLDDPWEEGNPKRAALGRLTGRTSVPSIWIGGEYIGGCEDGPSENAPGLVPMAFKGTLRSKLEKAGALRTSIASGS